MVAVRSSNVAAHGYDHATQTLAVKFQSGGTYHYAGVPHDLAVQFAAAPSKGSFFAAHVRNKFASTKVDGTAPPSPPMDPLRARS
jgi:hypothetical protein